MPVAREKLTQLFQEAVNVSYLFLLRGSGVVASFLMNLLIVRHYGVETNGLFQVGLSYAMIGAAVGRLGQEQLALREIAAFRVKDAAESAKMAVNLSLAVTLPAAFIVAGLVAAIAFFWSSDDGGMIPNFAPTIIFLTWLWIITEALRGWQRVPSAVFWQGSFIPVAFVAIFLLLNSLGVLRANALPLLYSGCALVALFGAAYSWRRVTREDASSDSKPQGNLGWRSATLTVRQGSMFWALAILTNVAGWLDLLVLYAFADATIVGIFQPIIRTGGLIAVAINIATAGLVARLALFYAAGDGKAFFDIANVYWRAISLISLVVGVVFIIMAPTIAAAWGPEIAPYHRELSLYVVIQLVQAVFIIAPLAAPIMGLERSMVVVQIINVPLKAAAVAIGYAQAGLMGVIVGIGLCTLVSVLWIVFLFFRQLETMGIRWPAFLTGRP